MNVRGALRATLRLAKERGMPQGEPNNPLSFAHMEGMMVKVAMGGMSYDKLCVGLGWMQCALVGSGVATLDEVELLNRKFRQDDPNDVYPDHSLHNE
jgi:hypothetical protein